MDITNAIILAFALGFDAFAVAVAVGIKLGKLDRWTIFRLSFHFGFAQFGMPLIGFRIGTFVYDWVGSAGNWIAGAILFGIGAHLIYEQFQTAEKRWQGDPTRGASLLALMFATSIDALAAGLSLALVGVDILQPALVIGVVAAAMTIIGLVSGHSVGIKFSRTAAIIGGLILMGLAVITAFS